MNSMRRQKKECTKSVKDAKRSESTAGMSEQCKTGPPYFSEEEVVHIQTSLLEWYDTVHRVLPWRRTPHSKKDSCDSVKAEGTTVAIMPAPDSLDCQKFAYYVWVSEIMLQQTQVATVVPYFNKWVTKWASVADLASATVEEVNTMWAGLGYYRRARYLLDGAKHVVDKLGGMFPTNAKDMLQIPGVGPYTSAAVASIAFNDAAAAVDGNVIRVVSRLRALPGDPTKLGQVHAAMAQEILDHERPGCFNQAVMELGATVCRPMNPSCSECPVQQSCRAHSQLKTFLKARRIPDLSAALDMEDIPFVTMYPGKKVSKEKRDQQVAVCVLEVIVTAGHHTSCSVGEAHTETLQQAERQGVSSSREPDVHAQSAVGVNLSASSGKRQRIMSDFFASKDKKTKKKIAAASLGQRWYMLVQRPDQGLLAGLWEFPGVVLEENCEVPPRDERQALVWELLERLLGTPLIGVWKGDASTSDALGHCPGSDEGLRAYAINEGFKSQGLKLLSVQDRGQYIHVFSHIKQTSHIEKIVVSVDDLGFLQSAATINKTIPAEGNVMKNAVSKRKALSGSEAGRSTQTRVPDFKWVKAEDMEQAGLPTLTSKIFKIATSE
ncbi:hypothetical protein CEUSTIGMA_g11817.t1 [Chlamydomonas eustigma]|uniref:Adenine DNA glycosylase n=1 Tax=Chlamydomonas eustigma TaxID=1157962 RepID=A0A250XMR6_9CHLO|nr:hypothetical protein CEUSTIGMA_g11817.t1 [Chlamydomonas eustigma]|eukprot:GAX84395.1 hypothetical protein CEUSTIGMA_g11817.t1 [Chlamydomonas eustigma]